MGVAMLISKLDRTQRNLIFDCMKDLQYISAGAELFADGVRRFIRFDRAIPCIAWPRGHQ